MTKTAFLIEGGGGERLEGDKAQKNETELERVRTTLSYRDNYALDAHEFVCVSRRVIHQVRIGSASTRLMTLEDL